MGRIRITRTTKTTTTKTRKYRKSKQKKRKQTMFDFSKSEYLKIVDEAMLNSEYAKLLEMKIKGYTRPKMAMELNVSEPTLDVMIKKLKKKIKKIL